MNQKISRAEERIYRRLFKLNSASPETEIEEYIYKRLFEMYFHERAGRSERSDGIFEDFEEKYGRKILRLFQNSVFLIKPSSKFFIYFYKKLK